MKRVNLFAFFSLGKALRPIEDIADGATYGDVLMILAMARWEVRSLLSNDVINVRTCRQAALQLIEEISEVVPIDINEAFRQDRDKTASVEWWRVSRLKEATKKFETVLAEELGVLDTYAVAQKGAYSTPELIANADVIIPGSLRIRLPEQTLIDLREAGRCLAFETTTAAAFHTLRAVEAVLVAYLQQVTGKPAPARLRNWGVYLKMLREQPGADVKVIDFLDHVRNSYRNPITHPEAVLSMDEVLVLLGVATGAIVAMAALLPERS